MYKHISQVKGQIIRKDQGAHKERFPALREVKSQI